MTKEIDSNFATHGYFSVVAISSVAVHALLGDSMLIQPSKYKVNVMITQHALFRLVQQLTSGSVKCT